MKLLAKQGSSRHYNDEALALPTTMPLRLGEVVQAAQGLTQNIQTKSERHKRTERNVSPLFKREGPRSLGPASIQFRGGPSREGQDVSLPLTDVHYHWPICAKWWSGAAL